MYQTESSDREKNGAVVRGRTVVRSFSLHQGDIQLIDYIEEQLGTGSRSEAVRSAIRSFAAQIAITK